MFLILLPGPNFIGYYFMFRIVGHYLLAARRAPGADRDDVDRGAQRPADAAARRVVDEAPETPRAELVHEVAAALRLEHLASFFQRGDSVMRARDLTSAVGLYSVSHR